MPARPYQASGQSNSGALSLLVVACLGAAVVSGVVEGVVSKWLSLLILFPAALGGLVAFAAVRVIGRSHVRAPWVAAIVAGVAGLLAQAVLHGVQYAQFRHDVAADFAENPKFAGQDTTPVIDAFLEQDSGQRGFVGYLLLRARLGTVVTNAGHSADSGIKLTGIWYWILFGLNFLIAGGIAASSAYSRANEPYCEPCQSWYGKTEPVASGSADKSTVAGTVRALEGGMLSEVPPAFGAPTATGVAVFHLLRCASCADHEPQLSLTVVTGIGKKQKTHIAYKTMLRSDQAQILLRSFAAAKPSGPSDTAV